MKNRLFKSLVIENKQRYGVALLLCVGLVLSALTPAEAQSKSQRRVTALQLGDAPEGARVTIVSDSAINDYEAFRRGDRFYVKVPQADSASSLPHLRADGFEDVQVQKVGDGLLVSFKLQPGATARVDQRANKLDVVFSAANRSSNNAANGGRVGNTQASSDRARDAAGPIPSGSVLTARDRFVTDRVPGGNEQQPSQNPWTLTNPQSASNKNSKGGINIPPTTTSALSPSPVSSPSSILTPGASTSYSPLTSVTPAVPSTVRPNATGSGFVLNLKQRGSAVRHWAAANRLAALLGALILLSLILYLALALRNRQKTVVEAKRAKTPKVQPKYSGEGELKELSSPSEPTAHRAMDAADAGSQAVPATRAASPSGARGQQPANASAAAANAAHTSQWVLTKPTIATPMATADEQPEEEEREVFEL
jgi:hypothetical protein